VDFLEDGSSGKELLEAIYTVLGRVRTLPSKEPGSKIAPARVLQDLQVTS